HGPQPDPALLEGELVARVREAVGAIASLRRVFILKRLPKTRSGKILRKTLRSLAASPEVAVPPTIEDPAVLDEVREVFEQAGCYDVAQGRKAATGH
ncbi:MAG: propionyl-CoA synthetase, partial [Starkeya sp.]|nr:propionyl-CoA synthetase [Starkeya sp.]